MIKFLSTRRKFKYFSEEVVIQKLKNLDTKCNDESTKLYLFVNVDEEDDITSPWRHNSLAIVGLVRENNSFYSETNMEILFELDRKSGGIVYI